MAKGAKIALSVIPGTSRQAQLYRVLRYFIYALIVVVLGRGILTFFQDDHVISTDVGIPITINDEAQSFAEAFAAAYFTFTSGEKDDYVQKVKSFVAPGLMSENAGMNFVDGDYSYRVKGTLPWKMTEVSPNKADIDVRVEVERVSKKGETDSFYRYLRVSVAHNDQGYVIDDFPTALPQPAVSAGEIASFPELTEASDEVKNAVRISLEDFFKAYSIDPPSKLRYFMTDGHEIEGYNGSIAFDALNDLRVYYPADASTTSATGVDHVQAYATTSWIDEKGFTMIQHFTLDLKFKEERWNINTLQGGFKS